MKSWRNTNHSKKKPLKKKPNFLYNRSIERKSKLKDKAELLHHQHNLSMYPSFCEKFDWKSIFENGKVSSKNFQQKQTLSLSDKYNIYGSKVQQKKQPKTKRENLLSKQKKLGNIPKSNTKKIKNHKKKIMSK